MNLKRSISNYRDILSEEFERRRASRPGYSLQTFARVVGVSRPHLLLVLEGKRGLSVKMAEQIAENLKFGMSKKSVFLASVEATHSRSPIKRRRARSFLKTYKEVNDGKCIDASWLVHAVWVLVDLLPELSMERLEITAAILLDVPPSTVARALDQLMESKMIEKHGQSLRATHGTDTQTTDWSNRYFKETLQQGAKALGDQRRHWAISSMVFGIKRSRKDEAVKMLRNFAEQLPSTFHTDDDVDDVVLLNLHLFSLLHESVSKPDEGSSLDL